VKRRAHDADLKEMVVIRSSSPQLVPFKLHRFGQQRRDIAIETARMLKSVFKLPLRALEGFINSLFQLIDVPLQSPDYCCISKRAKQVNI